MGTGSGGSLKNNKRTSAGVKPSSVLQMSKVGEGEAKYGVLGSLKLGSSDMASQSSDISPEVMADAHREVLDERTNELFNQWLKVKLAEKMPDASEAERDKIIAGFHKDKPNWYSGMKEKIHGRVAGLMQTPGAVEAVRERAVELMEARDADIEPSIEHEELVLNSPAADEAPQHISANMDEVSKLVSAPVSVSQEEIYNKFEEIDTKLRGLADARLKKLGKATSREGQPLGDAVYAKTSSEADALNQRGFYGALLHRARKDPALRELFLRLSAIADQREESKSTPRSAEVVPDTRALELVVLNHIKGLKRDGRGLEEDPNNLNLAVKDPLATDKSMPYALAYYRALLSNPETRKMMEDAMNKPDMYATKDSLDFVYEPETMASEDAPADFRKVVSAEAKPVHEMTHEGIDKIRESIGVGSVPTPEFMRTALEDQPVSQTLFQLFNVDTSKVNPAVFENYMSAAKMAESAQKFDDGVGNKDYGMTTFEKAVMAEYTDGLYDDINGLLRRVSFCLEAHSKTDDKDLRGIIENRLYGLMKRAKEEGTLDIVSGFMTGMGKILAKDKNQPRVVTRGGTESPMKMAEMQAGNYLYDPSVASAADIENWKSMWSDRKTQYVLTTDKYVSAEVFTENPGEFEYILFPGTMYRVDFVRRYKDKSGAVIDAIAGRQADVPSSGKPRLMSGVGAPKLGEDFEEEADSKRVDRAADGSVDVSEYEKRLDDVGGRLSDWLF